MINYMVQVLLFQTVFLAVYDLILKKETFFQWNRVYLIITSMLAYFIPFFKFQTVKENVPQEYIVMLPEVILSPATYIEKQIDWSVILFDGLLWVFLIGVILAGILFILKIIKIFSLIHSNNLEKNEDYCLVLLQGQNTAFSFFKYIFIGNNVQSKKDIIKHEIIHVKQKHSLDLLLFEIQKIVFWFNPYSYLYQNRITEIHEFIADSRSVSKKEKSTFFNSLLAEAFQVDKIAFVNSFNNQSLIKKRIIMFSKKSSKEILKFKYLLMIPVLMGMLIYTSCETNSGTTIEEQSSLKNSNEKVKLRMDIGTVRPDGKLVSYKNLTNKEKEAINSLPDKEKYPNGEIYRMKNNELSFFVYKDIKNNQNENTSIPFAKIDQVPVFPGCADEVDQKACFMEKITTHISSNFDKSIIKDLEAETNTNINSEKIKTKVYVQFTIDKKGNITNIKSRGKYKELEKEAVRVISSLPQMQPGKDKGNIVAVKYTLPISF